MCNAILPKYSHLKTDFIKVYGVLSFFHYDTLIDIHQKIQYWSVRPSALTMVGKLGKCAQTQSHCNTKCCSPTHQLPMGTHSFPVGTQEQFPQKSHTESPYGARPKVRLVLSPARWN